MTTEKGSNPVGPNAKYFEDFAVGEEWFTPRRTITEADLLMFSGLTGDFNPIHTDEEFAKTTVFGARIFHGPAAFSVATGLESRLGIKEGTAIAFLGMNWNLKAPIMIGDTIHVYQRVDSLRPTSKGGRGIVNFWVELRKQDGTVCQDGEWKVMFACRDAG